MDARAAAELQVASWAAQHGNAQADLEDREDGGVDVALSFARLPDRRFFARFGPDGFLDEHGEAEA